MKNFILIFLFILSISVLLFCGWLSVLSNIELTGTKKDVVTFAVVISLLVFCGVVEDLSRKK